MIGEEEGEGERIDLNGFLKKEKKEKNIRKWCGRISGVFIFSREYIWGLMLVKNMGKEIKSYIVIKGS